VSHLPDFVLDLFVELVQELDVLGLFHDVDDFVGGQLARLQGGHLHLGEGHEELIEEGYALLVLHGLDVLLDEVQVGELVHFVVEVQQRHAPQHPLQLRQLQVVQVPAHADVLRQVRHELALQLQRLLLPLEGVHQVLQSCVNKATELLDRALHRSHRLVDVREGVLVHHLLTLDLDRALFILQLLLFHVPLQVPHVLQEETRLVLLRRNLRVVHLRQLEVPAMYYYSNIVILCYCYI
jgi:hypothetical protein